MNKFKSLGVADNILDALIKKGFEEPTPIQEKIIPLLLNTEKDIIGQAQTGTGKTAAFGIPMLQLIKERTNTIQALILTPTRELALQVAEELNSLQHEKRLNIVPIYGGQSIDLQFQRLKKGADIVVGTPGRILDHIDRRTIKFNRISFLVLDEADEMLNMGFIDDVEMIMKATSPEKRTMLFSATMPAEILKIARKYMKETEKVSVQSEQVTTSLTDQIYFEVNEADKFEALCRIIDIEKKFYGLIFCRTKISANHIVNQLIDRGYDADAIHGDISQALREKILSKFKKGKINILVATDVAARGIDISNLSHVINFSLPQDPESYVHRIGRTGRAGKEGTAVTFVTPEEYRKLQFIKKIAKTNIRKEELPEISDIIQSKIDNIKSEIREMIQSEEIDKYSAMAVELISENGAQQVISALLKYSFQNELDESNYSEIRKVQTDMPERCRLFIARGKVDNMTKFKLLDFIREKTNIDTHKLRDISIHEKFSFVTAPFAEAETIVNIFKKMQKGNRPLIEIAKGKKKKK